MLRRPLPTTGRWLEHTAAVRQRRDGRIQHEARRWRIRLDESLNWIGDDVPIFVEHT